MPLTDRFGVLAVTQQAPGTSFTDRLLIWLMPPVAGFWWHSAQDCAL